MAKAYIKWIELVKDLGGNMRHEKQGMPQGGAWIINLGSRSKIIYSGGRTNPELDECYVSKPGIVTPGKWDDYTEEFLVDCAKQRLEKWFPSFFEEQE